MTQSTQEPRFAKESLESVPCPICRSWQRRHLFSFRPFRVYQCAKCDFGYLSPRLKEEEMSRIYSEGYFSSSEAGKCGYASYADMESELRKTFLLRYKRLRPLLRDRRSVLDVGCAFGYGLDILAHDFTWRCGLDIVPEAIAEVRKSGHEGFLGTLDEAPWQPETFDLLTAYEVIEHVYDPVEFVAVIGRLLRPGGVAAFAMPNLSSWLSKLSGRNWVSFKIPEHVGYFTPESIRYLLREQGFELAACTVDCQYAPGGLLLARIGSSFPVFQPLSSLLLRSPAIRSASLRVPNGNMLIVARKIAP